MYDRMNMYRTRLQT